MRVPRLERLRSIAEIARMVDRPRRTMLRQLMNLHRVTRANGGREWLFRAKVQGKWLINLSILWSEHPALFERRYPKREEFEELRARVETLENQLAVTKTRLKTVAARTRETDAPQRKSFVGDFGGDF